MAAELLRVADAVVETLNSATLSMAVTAVRLYQPQFELTEMQTLHVTVVPRTKTTQTLTRAQNISVYSMEIGVQKKLNAGDAAELDPLVMLVDEIAALFDRKRLDSVPEAICTATKPDPIYAPEHMEQFRQFTSILTLEFKVIG